jgi:cytochrome P450
MAAPYRDELRELGKPEATTEEPQFLKAGEAPILEAVINEALRLHPAAPSSLPRATPAGGAQLSEYYIPEGVCISPCSSGGFQY